MKSPSRYSAAGLAMIEVLIAAFILGISALAATGLVVVGTRTSIEGERQAAALSLSNEVVETIRGLRFGDVGFMDPIGSEPNGFLSRTSTIVSNATPYNVDYIIELVDDPANGLLPFGTLSEATADYKKVSTKSWWETLGSSEGTRDVSLVTHLYQQGACEVTCAPGEPNACPEPAIIDPNLDDATGNDGDNGDDGNDGQSNLVDGAPVFGDAEVCFKGGGGASCVSKPNPCPASGVCPLPIVAPTCEDGLFCPQCSSDFDCDGGFVCNEGSGQCEAQPGACRTKNDCPANSVCGFNGQCVTSCVEGGCSSGEVCNPDDGLCSAPCSENSCVCPAGRMCDPETDLCVTPTPTPTPTPSPTPDPSPTPSVSSTPTPSGSETPSPSSTSSETPSPNPNPTSSGGPCSNDQQCPSGAFCFNGTCKTIVDITTGCSSDQDCSSGLICSNGTCQGPWCGDPSVQCTFTINDPLCPPTNQCPTPSPSPTPTGGGGGPSNTFCPNCPTTQPSSVWCDTDGDGQTNCGPGGSVNVPPGQSCQDVMGNRPPCASDSDCGAEGVCSGLQVFGTCTGFPGTSCTLDLDCSIQHGQDSVCNITNTNPGTCTYRTQCCHSLDNGQVLTSSGFRPCQAAGEDCRTDATFADGTCESRQNSPGTGCEYFVCVADPTPEPSDPVASATPDSTPSPSETVSVTPDPTSSPTESPS